MCFSVKFEVLNEMEMEKSLEASAFPMVLITWMHKAICLHNSPFPDLILFKDWHFSLQGANPAEACGCELWWPVVIQVSFPLPHLPDQSHDHKTSDCNK